MASENVFTVRSIAEIAIREYYLDVKQWHHILLGHRGMINAVTAITATVEEPTHIYKTIQAQFVNRLVFVSYDVVIGKNRPIKVIIERQGDIGKVITATWSSGVKGELIWDSHGSVMSNYDSENDIFYISKPAFQQEYAVDDDDISGVWLRKSDADDSPQGVTIFGLKSSQDFVMIVDRVATFLGATRSEVETRMRAAIGK